jgi:hypothetical protein
MINTPLTKRIPINRWIQNQTIGKQTPPDSPTETTTKENTFSTFLTSKSEFGKGRTCKAPTTHLFFSGKSILKHQPKNECMFRNSQLKPDKLMPINLGNLGQICFQVYAQKYFLEEESQTRMSSPPMLISGSLLCIWTR